MKFDHEKLDVYRLSLEFVTSIHALLHNHQNPLRAAKDQLTRSSLSIPLNIAEGNAKWTSGERRRFFEIARGSAMESAAVLDVFVALRTFSADDVENIKGLLVRIVSMLTRMVETESVFHR
jgi:four helix bundle protein